MAFVSVTSTGGIATVTLKRGKVNAFNEPMVEEMLSCFREMTTDDAIRSVILTGTGKFFSFGFDIPALLDYGKDDYTRFLESFSTLYRELFLFPKPVIAALNGHTIAGGCMLSNACDHRILVDEGAKISLNEISFGAGVFAGSVDILRYLVGNRNAETVLYSGSLYGAEEARQLGLVEQLASPEKLMGEAAGIAIGFAKKDAAAFACIKQLLRGPLADAFAVLESDSIRKFVDIWYSDSTQKQLRDIRIR